MNSKELLVENTIKALTGKLVENKSLKESSDDKWYEDLKNAQFNEEDRKFIESLVGDKVDVILQESRQDHFIIDLKLAKTEYIESGIVNFNNKFYDTVEKYIEEKHPGFTLATNNTGSTLWVVTDTVKQASNRRPTEKMI